MQLKTKILRTLTFGLIGLTLAACRDDLTMDYGNSDLGEKVHGTLSIPIGSSGPVIVTRAVDFSPNAMVKIDSYWLGVFDTKTGELLGSAFDERPRKDDDTRYTLYNNSTPFTVNDIDIWYYDNNPEVYIVGVINFNDVKANDAGEDNTYLLSDKLQAITSFDEYSRISIDAASADSANRSRGSDESCPLMSGLYITGTSSLHANINPDGSLNNDAARVNLLSASDKHSTMTLPEGNIKLNRLIAEMNYTVVAGPGVTIDNVEYIVVNNPTEVYLAEHATDQEGGTTRDKDVYLSRTPNSADFKDNAFTSTPDYIRASRGSDGFTFSYQAYENKHWGRKWVFPEGYDQNSHLVRETRYDDKTAENGKSDVFRTLCQYAEAPYNNSASYVIVKVTMSAVSDMPGIPEDAKPTFENTLSSTGTVYFTIHEGAASRPEGSINTADSRGYDYQRIRNTRYNYVVTVNGLNSLLVQTYPSEMSDMMSSIYPHNDGITGEAWTTDKWEVTQGTIGLSVTFLTKEDFKNFNWRFYYKTPDQEYNYGYYKKDINAPSYFPEWPDLPNNELNNKNVPDFLCDNIKIDLYEGVIGPNGPTSSPVETDFK